MCTCSLPFMNESLTCLYQSNVFNCVMRTSVHYQDNCDAESRLHDCTSLISCLPVAYSTCLQSNTNLTNPPIPLLLTANAVFVFKQLSLASPIFLLLLFVTDRTFASAKLAWVPVCFCPLAYSLWICHAWSGFTMTAMVLARALTDQGPGYAYTH